MRMGQSLFGGSATEVGVDSTKPKRMRKSEGDGMLKVLFIVIVVLSIAAIIAMSVD